jgi:hypothetical protein
MVPADLLSMLLSRLEAPGNAWQSDIFLPTSHHHCLEDRLPRRFNAAQTNKGLDGDMDTGRAPERV